MKAKQKKIRVFDIVVESEDKFFEFMNKNLILVKDYLLLVSGEITPKIEDYLKENSLCYVVADGCKIKSIDSKAKEQQQPVVEQKEQEPQIIVQERVVYQDVGESSKTLVVTKPIRSGGVVESEGDIVIFSRVNSGAKVVAEGNVSIFETIDGIVEANGDFIILKSIDKGYVVFNGDILDKDDFDGTLKKVLATSDGYKIEEV